MKKRSGYFHIGSFQYPNRFESENPLEEVWSRIARYGAIDYLKAHLHPEKSDIDWGEHIKYAIVRAKQAVEFRNSAKKTTLLTSPLALYYSFLNLTRAFLALGPEIIPSSSHGLKFIKGDDLLSSSAKLTNGTFTEYLSAFGYQWQKGTIISLSDAFSRIIEIHQDFISIKGNVSYVVPVNVRAIDKGPIYIDLFSPYKEFSEKWKSEFPRLKNKCVLDEDGESLIINDEIICENTESIMKYLNELLYPQLSYNSMINLWFLIREVEKKILFSRASYYYIAIFILGSIVRYEPELMLKVSQLDSELGWFVNRFIQKAERYFPQLKLSEQCKTTIYF